MTRIAQYERSIDGYAGLPASNVTSNVMYWGDASMVNYSLTTSSATPSTWTIQGYLGDDAAGFRTALPAPAASWFNVVALSGPAFNSMTTIPRWARVLRTPSHSSSTIFFSYYVGP